MGIESGIPDDLNSNEAAFLSAVGGDAAAVFEALELISEARRDAQTETSTK